MPRPRPFQILLAVADRTAGSVLRDYLGGHGTVCTVAETAHQAQAVLQEQSMDAVVLDLSGGAISLDQIRALASDVMVVGLAAPDPDSYFRAAKAGIEAVLAMPLDAQDYAPKLERMRQKLRSKSGGNDQEANALAGDPAGSEPLLRIVPDLFATSEDMAEVRELIEKVAPTSATVLLRGESGVGKELAARLIHSRSRRSGRPFVKVNCAAIPNELLESELFGYEAGAFTGAAKGKPGKFELANRGTIFLDEIGELHPTLQAKLLHVLQDGEFARLGAKRDTAVDVRVICATNKLLDVLVADGRFREDLFYRINVIAVTLPPLRARVREIPLLAEYFVNRYASIYGKPAAPIEGKALQAFQAYAWPGNIRELENLCKRYVIVGSLEQICRELEQKQKPAAIDILKAAAALPTTESGGPSLLEIGRRAAWAAERAAIESMLQTTHWNRREAARRLNVSYKALLNKIEQMENESSQSAS